LEKLYYHEDPKDIHKILLLFNIISMMEIEDESVRFPFDKYKENGTQWSLEHIHAQNAELNTNDDMHSLSNLALLDTKHNSALGNSTFNEKRKTIIEKDKKGEFIPYCTRMVFLKYYSKNTSQLYFWSKNDRKNYMKQIIDKLEKYLPKTETDESK